MPKPNRTQNPGAPQLEDLDHFGFWLDFHPAVAARYEADTGTERVTRLRSAIIIGLIFYNIYNVTDAFCLRDVAIYSLMARLLVVTPASFGLVWLVSVVSARVREIAITLGMINVFTVPLFMFWLSSDPLGLYTFGELSLTLMFGTMMLVLRFPAACAFVGAAFVATSVAIVTKRGVDPTLMFIFVVQIGSASAFVLVGNYWLESWTRRNYLNVLREELRSDGLERDRSAFAMLSNTDSLTGVSNRRYFDDRLQSAALAGETRALLMIDVDFFKAFNDSYGHPQGDACLRRIAAILKAEVRGGSNVVARYGGEEFFVVLNDASTIAQVESLAERLRAQVMEARLPHAGRRDGYAFVTVSIGAVYIEAGTWCAPSTLVDQADAALYQAKDSGRNAIVVRSLRGESARAGEAEAA